MVENSISGLSARLKATLIDRTWCMAAFEREFGIRLRH